MNLDQLRIYVDSKGWQPHKPPFDRVLVFTGPADDSGRPIELVLPTRDDFVDSKRLLESALDLLAAIEDIPHPELIKAIQRASPNVHENYQSDPSAQPRAETDWFFKFALPLALSVGAIALIVGGAWYVGVYVHHILPTGRELFLRFSEMTGVIATLALLTLLLKDLQAELYNRSSFKSYAALLLINILVICLYALYFRSFPMVARLMQWQGIMLPAILLTILTISYFEQREIEKPSFLLSYANLLVADIVFLLIVALVYHR